MIALEVRNLSKFYPIGGSQWSRFRHVLAAGRVPRDRGIRALYDVSFHVERGEAFGVVGANGSGKSTLLQIVAGILQPTSGSVTANGRLSALLELGSGFSTEFTGRENVYLNASILGLAKEEIDARFAAIEAFASIGDFIDRPIRTYSTGMVLRLAFAVVAHVDPEILIVDEALAVGDIAFRQRCMKRIHALRGAGVTILFVSHETGDVKALCERCVWLDKGEVRALGDTDSVIADYLSATLVRERAHNLHAPAAHVNAAAEAPGDIEGRRRYGSGAARFISAELLGERDVVLRAKFLIREPLSNPIAGFLLRNEKGETIFGSNTERENIPLPGMNAGESHTVDFHWTMPELAAGRYFISVAISQGTLDEFGVCDYVEDVIVFASGNDGVRGYLRIPCAGIAVQKLR